MSDNLSYQNGLGEGSSFSKSNEPSRDVTGGENHGAIDTVHIGGESIGSEFTSFEFEFQSADSEAARELSKSEVSIRGLPASEGTTDQKIDICENSDEGSNDGDDYDASGKLHPNGIGPQEDRLPPLQDASWVISHIRATLASIWQHTEHFGNFYLEGIIDQSLRGYLMRLANLRERLTEALIMGAPQDTAFAGLVTVALRSVYVIGKMSRVWGLRVNKITHVAKEKVAKLMERMRKLLGEYRKKKSHKA
ncbi:hypothetical protein K490DRAFT_64562 [Saccharata proteae CBS 121410]|uniref:Uncharacterized protein n=1 Tax=Saccharata proteae CBS 121410 TaxID=1314787 RepID=A0A9P4HXX9_9PEZI|nr:hypothetical protein K490DRAFT_64562 [Saccharata proteae CBS 121410]